MRRKARKGNQDRHVARDNDACMPHGNRVVQYHTQQFHYKPPSWVANHGSLLSDGPHS